MGRIALNFPFLNQNSNFLLKNNLKIEIIFLKHPTHGNCVKILSHAVGRYLDDFKYLKIS